MVGRLLSFWEGLLSGAMLVSGRVSHKGNRKRDTFWQFFPEALRRRSNFPLSAWEIARRNEFLGGGLPTFPATPPWRNQALFLRDDESPEYPNYSQTGNLPQIGVKIKNLWNHHLANNQLIRPAISWHCPLDSHGKYPWGGWRMDFFPKKRPRWLGQQTL